MPKYRNVKYPYTSLDGFVLLNYLIEKSGVDPNQLVVTSGYRTEQHNKKSGGVKGSRHLHGDAFDFGGNDSENIKLRNYIENNITDIRKDFPDFEWVNKYEDDHFHVASKSKGPSGKGKDVVALYEKYQSNWTNAGGTNGLIDMTKIPDWSNITPDVIKPQTFSKYTVDGKEPDTQPGQSKKVWSELSDDEKAKVKERYAEADERLSKAANDEERKKIKSEYQDIFQYGTESVADYYKDKRKKLQDEQIDKYGLRPVYENYDKIEALEKEKMQFTEGVDDEDIKRIDDQINKLQASNGNLIMKADYERKSDTLEKLMQKAKNGELTANEKIQLDGLRKQLPDEKQRSKIYGKLADEVALGTNEEKVNIFIDGIGKDGVHPYLIQTTRDEFQKEYQKKYKDKWLFENTGRANLEREGNELRRFGEDFWNEMVNPMTTLGQTLLWMGAEPISTKKRDQSYADLKDGQITFDRFMWEEGMLDEWINKQAEIGEMFDATTIEEIKKQIPWDINFDESDFTTTQQEKNDAVHEDRLVPDNETEGDTKTNETADPFASNQGFEYNPEEQSLFEKAGGVDAVLGLGMAAMGMADAGEINLPEQKMIDDMMITHAMNVKRLSEIGMPLVEQAKVRQEMDESFNVAKRAIMDAGNMNRGQILSAISGMSGERQKAALAIEMESSKMRREALYNYGEITRYINDFNTSQHNLNAAREFEVEKANKEGAGKLIASGIDNMITAANNSKLYGKGSTYDMMNKYMEWDMKGGGKIEEDYYSIVNEKFNELNGGAPEKTPNTGPNFTDPAAVMINNNVIPEAEKVMEMAKQQNPLKDGGWNRMTNEPMTYEELAKYLGQ
jgi:hypothetical protein